MTEVCPTCAGVGVVPSDETRAITIERELRTSLRSRADGGSVVVTVHPRIADVLAGEDGARLADLGAETGVEIRLERDGSLALEGVRVRALDGGETVAPAAKAPPARTSASRRKVSSRSG
jgi:Ribonuclease G/E